MPSKTASDLTVECHRQDQMSRHLVLVYKILVPHWSRASSSHRHGLSLKKGFPSQNSLDKKIIVFVIFPAHPPFLFCLGFLVFGLFDFWDRVWLWPAWNVLGRTDWLWIHRGAPASAFWVLGLEGWLPHPPVSIPFKSSVFLCPRIRERECFCILIGVSWVVSFICAALVHILPHVRGRSWCGCFYAQVTQKEVSELCIGFIHHLYFLGTMWQVEKGN